MENAKISFVLKGKQRKDDSQIGKHSAQAQVKANVKLIVLLALVDEQLTSV